MYRLLGIPAAALVIVGAPQLIALQGNSSSPAATATVAQPSSNTPPPPVAALTVRLSGHAGMTGDPILLRILAKGDQPEGPAKVTELAAADGLDTAKVTPEPIAECANVQTRATSAGTDEWCLSLEGVGAGHDLTGVVKGGTTLTLTVSRRHSFWPWPFWVLIGGLLTGLGAALAPPRLRSEVQTVQLDRLIESNKNTSEQIDGLKDWVDKQRRAGQSASDLYALLYPVVRFGPEREQVVRQALLDALKTSGLSNESAFAKKAMEVAKAPNSYTDFLDDSSGVGALTTAPYPATTWLNALAKLVSAQKDLDTARTTIKGFDKPVQEKLEPELTSLEHVFAGIENPDGLSDFEAGLVQLKKDVDLHVSAAPIQLETYAFKLGVNWDLGRTLLAGLEGHPDKDPRLASLAGDQLRIATGEARLFTAVACLVVLGFAGVTVEQTNYAPNVDFAGFVDYFKLFSAALASTAVGTALGFLGYWQPGQSSSGSAAPMGGKKKGTA